jgi:hypothetical protein
MFKIIDNFLSQEEFLKVKNFMLNPNFPWNLTPVVSIKKEINEKYDSLYQEIKCYV